MLHLQLQNTNVYQFLYKVYRSCIVDFFLFFLSYFTLFYLVNTKSILLFRGDVAHAGGANHLNKATRKIHTYVAVDPAIIPKDNVYILPPRKSDIQNKKIIIQATAPNIKKLVMENKIVSKFMYGHK